MTDQNGSARRCGAVHEHAGAVCALPAGHEGDHANRQGHWSPKPLDLEGSQTPEPVLVLTDQTCEGNRMLVLWVLAIAFTLMAVTTTAALALMLWGTWQDRRQARLERRRLHIQHMADRNGHRRRVHIDD